MSERLRLLLAATLYVVLVNTSKQCFVALGEEPAFIGLAQAAHFM